MIELEILSNKFLIIFMFVLLRSLNFLGLRVASWFAFEIKLKCHKSQLSLSSPNSNKKIDRCRLIFQNTEPESNFVVKKMLLHRGSLCSSFLVSPIICICAEPFVFVTSRNSILMSAKKYQFGVCIVCYPQMFTPDLINQYQHIHYKFFIIYLI